jgi:chemotaxis protein CheX
MPVAFDVETHQIDVSQIVENVFRTMLGLEVRQSEADRDAAPNSLTAAVHFVGEWNGVVLLQCGLPEALAFSNCLMLDQGASDVDEDVRDTLGELANMVGGNLKSVLPSGVALSIPSVVAGTDWVLHICGGNAFKTVTFSSDLGVFWVTLVRVLEKGR